jgi:hypothetical protein
VAAENFVELVTQDARNQEVVDEKTQKIQLPFFLVKLLNEFKSNDISSAVDA